MIARIKKLYSKMKIRYKLMLYFWVFGVLIGYISFLIVVVIASAEIKFKLKNTIHEWRERNLTGTDSIDRFIGEKYTREMTSAIPFIAFIGKHDGELLNVREVSFFEYDMLSNRWFELYFDEKETLQKAEILDYKQVDSIKHGINRTRKFDDYIYFGASDYIDLWFNLTKKTDGNLYLIKITLKRSSIFEFYGWLSILVYVQ